MTASQARKMPHSARLDCDERPRGLVLATRKRATGVANLRLNEIVDQDAVVQHPREARMVPIRSERSCRF